MLSHHFYCNALYCCFLLFKMVNLSESNTSTSKVNASLSIMNNVSSNFITEQPNLAAKKKSERLFEMKRNTQNSSNGHKAHELSKESSSNSVKGGPDIRNNTYRSLENDESMTRVNVHKRKTGSSLIDGDTPENVQSLKNNFNALLSLLSGIQDSVKKMSEYNEDASFNAVGREITTSRVDEAVEASDDFSACEDGTFNSYKSDKLKCFTPKTSILINDDADAGRYIVAVPLKDLLELFVKRFSSSKGCRKRPIPLVVLDKGEFLNCNGEKDRNDKLDNRKDVKKKYKGSYEKNKIENKHSNITIDRFKDIGDLNTLSNNLSKIARRSCKNSLCERNEFDKNLAVEEKIKCNSKLESQINSVKDTNSDRKVLSQTFLSSDRPEQEQGLMSKPLCLSKDKQNVVSDTKADLVLWNLLRDTRVKPDKPPWPVKDDTSDHLSNEEVEFQKHLVKKIVNDVVGKNQSSLNFSYTNNHMEDIQPIKLEVSDPPHVIIDSIISRMSSLLPKGKTTKNKKSGKVINEQFK